MKTTVDLCDGLLERTKVAAVRQRTAIRNLIIEGLDEVLREEVPDAPPADALARLCQGYHLGGDLGIAIRPSGMRSDPMALSGASSRKRISSSNLPTGLPRFVC